MQWWRFVDWSHVNRVVRGVFWFIILIVVLVIVCSRLGTTSSHSVHCPRCIQYVRPR